MTAIERKSNAKLDFIKKIEHEQQEKWKVNKYFEIDAISTKAPSSKTDKYFVTFPYPYMNGRLHLGHSFSLTKCEFSVGYNRLKGKRCLFPFGLHCTGMPIKACADKLKYELEAFGYPPDFNKPLVEGTTRSSGMAQWEIMQSFGLSNEEIKKFTDPMNWLAYFPPYALSDITSLGVKVDLRRSFITTDANPFYDSFVRWQFIRLKERNKINFGKRHTIFSPKDNQPCMDHDRISGEGVGPQEYVAVKFKLLEDRNNLFSSLNATNIYLLAATLRPETLYGATNCYVQPDLDYIIYPAREQGDYYISNVCAARNISYQGLTEVDNQHKVCKHIKGHELIGCKVSAPLSLYPSFYVLPMMHILANKGTSIVVSVPSDSPDDYAALNDLREKPAFRKKYNVTDEMVFPFKEIPIIDVPNYGSLCASAICKELKINSQNDTLLLKEAKEIAYKSSFYNGRMLIDEFKGKLVNEVKKNIRDKLIDSKSAFVYMEPESTVISRSGDVCVVALCDQWYLIYGDPEWRKEADKALSQLETYSTEVRNNFNATLDWLHEHACSRQYGLGTKLPWDEVYLIESLSDSTIYMAYYTIAHLLQGGTLDGSKPNVLNIKAEQLTPEVWDYVFLDKPFPPSSTIPQEKLDKLRTEFKYWYPLDLRVSGKDLVPNHLTYCLYNHVAMWPNQPEMWPRAFRANGYLMLNSQKMSKSTGNFLTLCDAIDRFGADATRLGLADSGDTIEDANFVEKSADATILRLYTFVEWCKEMLCSSTFREGPIDSFCDKYFLNEISRIVVSTEQAYKSMLFREAIKIGFFDFQASRDWYKELSMNRMHKDLIYKYIEVQCILLSPICPHITDYIYEMLNKGSIMNASWPETGNFDRNIHESSKYLYDVISSFRVKLKTYKDMLLKKKSKVSVSDSCTIYISDTYVDWQQDVLTNLQKLYVSKENAFPDNKQILDELKKSEVVSAQKIQKVMTFMNHYKSKALEEGPDILNLTVDINEYALLTENLQYIAKSLDMKTITIEYAKNAPSNISDEALPLRPFIIYK